MKFTRRFNPIFLVLMMASLLLACAAFIAAPVAAHAQNYSMPKVDIVAEAQTDGSLKVSETRTFEFEGDYTTVWWSFDKLPSNASLSVDAVSLSQGSEEGKSFTPLSETSFNLSWRDSGGPGKNAYSIDSPKDTVYVFFKASNETIQVKFEYTIINGVTAYKDVGEVYWKYVGAQWAEPSSNVTMTLSVPVPEGTKVTPGDNIRAWGHGPLDGQVAINEDGTVTYTVPKVNAGQFAEARVVFPTEWLTKLSGDASLKYIDQKQLDTILKEEQTWADEANMQRIYSIALIAACALLSIAVLLWAVRAYLKYGKEHTPNFTEQYWRDVPSKQDHPLVISRLYGWNRENKNDFTTEIIYLTHKGVLQMHKGNYEQRGKLVQDYYLIRVPSEVEKLTNPIDIKTVEFLFDEIAGGAESLWFKTIEAYGKKNPTSFTSTMQKWQGTVTAETNKRDFFEIKGQKYQTLVLIVAIVYAIIGVAYFVVTENFFPLIFMIPTVIVLLVIVGYLPRRSQEGVDIDAKCKALKNWLKDFTALNERIPTDVKVWGEFMVYAYMFGIAKEVIKALEMKLPDLFEDGTSMTATSTYVPWWIWYSTSAHGMGGFGMGAAGDMLQTSVSNTISTAQAAASAVGGGGFSSGGGFGGGFSGGGGGGFGGGGGAR